jgi:hypothetical protein
MRVGKPKSRDVGPGLRAGIPLPLNQPPTREAPAPRASSALPGSGGGSAVDHALLSPTHTDADEQDPVAGDLIYANSTPLWTRLAIGTAGYVLKVSGGVPTWAPATITVQESGIDVDTAVTTLNLGSGLDATSSPAGTVTLNLDVGEVLTGDVSWAPPNTANVIGIQNVLIDAPGSGDDLKFIQYQHGATEFVYASAPGSANALLDGSVHTDTAAGTVVRGDLIVGNSTPKWGRLALGASGTILKSNGTDAAWAAVSTVATSSAALQAWRRNQIQNAGTSKAPMKGLEDLETGYTPDASGTIVGVSLDTETTLGATSADWYEVEAYVRVAGVWTATGITARLLGDSTDDYQTGTGSYAFTAGQKIQLYDQRTNLGGSTVGVKGTVRLVFN